MRIYFKGLYFAIYFLTSLQINSPGICRSKQIATVLNARPAPFIVLTKLKKIALLCWCRAMEWTTKWQIVVTIVDEAWDQTYDEGT